MRNYYLYWFGLIRRRRSKFNRRIAESSELEFDFIKNNPEDNYLRNFAPARRIDMAGPGKREIHKTRFP